MDNLEESNNGPGSKESKVDNKIESNESIFFEDPLEVTSGEYETTSSLKKITTKTAPDLHYSSRWKMLREHILIEENVPPSPPQSSVLTDKEEDETETSKVKRENNQSRPLRGVLRFKTTVQQRTESNKMEKDIEKLMSRKYSNNTLHGTTGSTVGTIGHQASYFQRLDNFGDRDQVNFMSDLFNILKQNKHVIRLPDMNECNQALDIFEFLKSTFRPLDENENFERILWCCKILETRNVQIRSRMCGIVEKFLNSTASNSFLPTSVPAIHSLIYTFVHTLVVTSVGIEGTEESIQLYKMIKGFLERLAAGTLISLDEEISIGNTRVQIQKYDSIARCIFMEGLVKCLLVKDFQLRKYVMENLISKYWITPDPTMKILYEHVIQFFAQATFEILSDQNSFINDLENGSLPYIILHILTNRLPANSLQDMSPHVVRSLIKFGGKEQSSDKGSLTSSTENLLLIPGVQKQSDNDALKLAKLYIESFWSEGWKNEIIELLKEAFEQDSLERIITIFEQMVFDVNEEIGREIVAATISDLFSKIVELQPENSRNLKQLLLTLSSKYRTEFFKPMLACVASDSESKVAEQLHLITTLRNYISGIELFMQDAELMTVIILSDVSSGTSKDDKHQSKLSTTSNVSKVSWGSTTLGQCAIIMEFLWTVRQLRLYQSEVIINSGSAYTQIEIYAKKFLNELELRLAVFMTAKEKTKLIPMPLRVLLSNLFFEIRLYCKTTNRPGWLSKMIDWLILSAPGSEIYHDSVIIGGTMANSSEELDVNEDQLNEVELIFQRVKDVYEKLDDWTSTELERKDDLPDGPVPAIPKSMPIISIPQKSKNSLVSYNNIRKRYSVSPSPKPSMHQSSSLPEGSRLYWFNNFKDNLADSILALLVAIYLSLMINEYTRLGPYIWNRFLNDREHKQFVSSAFLFIQCAEKSPNVIKDLMMRDLYSTNALVRSMTIRKISSIFGHRNQLLSQPYVSDSSRRRPFRAQAPPISFVPTELGNQFMMSYESSRAHKVTTNDTLSADVRKRIQEFGWEDDDPSDLELFKRIETPISLLPTFYLDEEEFKIAEESAAQEKIRRNVRGVNNNAASNNKSQPSSSKRRGISIPILCSFSMPLVDLLDDAHGGVYNLTKELIMYFLRDDPSLFLRIFFSDLGIMNVEKQKELITRIRFLISMQHLFPPNFTHILFNHLAGILKWYSRDNKENGLALMTYVIPTLAEMVPAINNLLVRDFRKNKIEHIICNNGQFWFSEGTPVTMFPRNLTDNRIRFHILSVPLELFQVAILRIGHIHFMTNYVVKCPHEVYSIKKMIHAFAPFPLSDDYGQSKSTEMNNEEDRFLPDINKRGKRISELSNMHSRKIKDYKLLSALRARSWLNFLLEFLKRLNTNYNDRNELNLFLSGANDILLEHSGDFGIVGQTLVLYMTVATKFRRLFDTNRGYSIFIPALFKIFCELENIKPIRSAITFTWIKFFNVHGESFIFQALGCLTPIILKGSAKSTTTGEWICSSLYELFKALNFPAKFVDTLGIFDIVDELDTSDFLIVESPSLLFNNTINNTLTSTFGNSFSGKLKTGLLGTHGDKIFSLDDLVRLFLTIIAYDPGSLRAEQFVHILQYLIPHLLQESSSVRSLVVEGIAALIEVFLKFSKSSKPLLSSTGISGSGIINIDTTEGNLDVNDTTSFNIQWINDATTQAFGKQWKQNDRMKIKRQFLTLIQVYKLHDGMLSDNSHNKMANIIRLMIKDYSTIKMRISTGFLKNYIRDALLFNTTFEDSRKPLLSILRQLSTSFRQHYKSIDFSGLIEGLALIVTNKCRFTINDHSMANILKEKFISFGFSVVLKSDWGEEGTEALQLRLCNSLIELFVAMMTHSELDMLSEIDKYLPSHQLMAYIIIPICLKYKPENAIFTPLPSKFDPRDANAKICWNRLLAYVTKACNKDFMQRKISRKSSFRSTNVPLNNEINKDIDGSEMEVQPKKVMSTSESAATFIISFTALKILLIRAEKYITQTNGMWVHIAQFIRQSLASSGKLRTGFYSSNSSPSASTTNFNTNIESRNDNLGISLQSDRVSFLSQGNNNNSHLSKPFPTTAHEFVLWTFLELILFYKLPINLYLRTFIHQKLQNTSSINSTNVNGPPIGIQQALNKSLEKEPSINGRNKFRINKNNPGSHHGGYNSVFSGVGNGTHANNLINETFKAYSNVCTLMGYQNNKNSQQELEAWSYRQVLEKLREETKLVSEAFKGTFKVSGNDETAGNGIDGSSITSNIPICGFE
ncbi:1797_t:CDS:10 [Diversispora eburnea]|uniref:1797_t:CDS:1 n=1 Tax=Diversispora eburnea TaxID=1213867 RepID=A0A9N8VMZ0_9GLOM|nr:1797_t:CDS:10 [Diversispora eburnea]